MYAQEPASPQTQDAARAPETAQAPETTGAPERARAPETTGVRVYLGGQLGALGGSSVWSVPAASGPAGTVRLFHGYDVVDGSGSQFGGLSVGYLNRRPSGVLLGGEADLAFGAEPPPGGGGFIETPEVFGAVRARVGYGAARWLTYGAGGLAWTRNHVAAAGIGDVSGPMSVYRQRIGWTVGGGVERSIDARWSANAEYLFARYGGTPVVVSPATQVRSGLSTHQLRVGLHYSFASFARDVAPAPNAARTERAEVATREDPLATSSVESQAAPSGVLPLDTGGWNVRAQTTYVHQYAAPFRAPYRGPNSLAPDIGRETWDLTVYVGRRLWRGAALWVNPELDQGFGLSNTLGVAGFTSGEAYKVGYAHPYVRVPRAFVQQTIDLGGAIETVDAGLNQFRGTRARNRLVATAGKFSVSDLFDTISYAHDPRSDFMNWSLVDAGTFDYAADAWGFTYGAALEWYQGRWVARGGLFDLSLVPNSIDLDSSFRQFQLVYEIEHEHTLGGRPGKLSLVGFVSRGRMGRYADAVASAALRGARAETAAVRRFDSRPGVNLNVSQQVSPDVGIFARVGWADGTVESYEFTDVDRTVSGGMSLAGRRWRRQQDTVGVAAVFNGISDVHRSYLAAGGVGILVGDGRLPHPGIESIVESYYRVGLGAWQLTADYQLVVNPAFNRDRGPVSVLGGRVRVQF